VADCADAPEEPAVDAGTRTEVVGAEKLIVLLQQRAQAAVDAGSTVPTLAVRFGPCGSTLPAHKHCSAAVHAQHVKLGWRCFSSARHFSCSAIAACGTSAWPLMVLLLGLLLALW